MFVEFFDSGTPAYYLKDCRYTGRRLVQVKKLPTTRLYLTTCRGAHDDLGFPSIRWDMASVSQLWSLPF